MRRYNELSKIELAALTTEQLDVLVDLEIAYEGIAPEICPTPLKEFDSGIKKSEVLYSVYGLFFKSEQDAQTLAAMQVFSSDYDYYGAGSNYRYVSLREQEVVSKTILYKKEDVERLKSILSARKKEEENYENELRVWQKYEEKTRTIRSNVYDAYHDALSFVRSLQKAKDSLEKYTMLADGDKVIARKFFEDAYKDKPDIISLMFPQVEE